MGSDLLREGPLWNWRKHLSLPCCQRRNLPSPPAGDPQRWKMPFLASVSLCMSWGKWWSLTPGTDEWIKCLHTGNYSNSAGAQWVLSTSGCHYCHHYKGLWDRGEAESPNKHKESPPTNPCGSRHGIDTIWVLFTFFDLVLDNMVTTIQGIPHRDLLERPTSGSDFRKGDFPGSPMVKNPPSNAEDSGSIPGWGTKIPHTSGQLHWRTTTTEPMCCNEDLVQPK